MRFRCRTSLARAAILWLTLASLALAGGSAGAQSPARDRIAVTVDSLARSALVNGPVAGISVAVVRGRDTLVMKGYGFADIENDVAATPQTVYRIGSITKQFTSAAIMQLVELGKIGLDDELTKYLPEFPVQDHKVTIRELLNHTSGIHSYTDLGPRWQKLWRLDMRPDSIVALVREEKFDFDPGTKWHYNNTGYVLLGIILERVTGRPYADYLRERFFAPLGLASTRYCDTGPLIKHRAQGYGVQDKQLVNAEFLSMTQPFSAGALCSTVGDLLAWERALTGGKVVSAASFAKMSTPEPLADGSPITYGYGLAAGKLGTHGVIEHGGGINGFSTHLAYYPDDSLTIVVLTNTAPADPQGIGSRIARVIFGMPLPKAPEPPREVALSDAERARYVGSYTIALPTGTKLPMRIFDQGSQLMGQAEGQGAIHLLAQGNHVFVPREDPGLRFTFTVQGDRATKFTLLQNGVTMDAPRTER